MSTQLMATLIQRAAAADNADLGRAHKARRYPHPHLDAEDDDYEFVEQSLDRWADRMVRDPAWALAKKGER